MTPHEPPVPLVIGWKEYLDFPEWGVRRVRAKIDTGARTSAVDALDYQLHEGPDRTWADVRLALHLRRPPVVVRVPVVRLTRVRNSGGKAEGRPVIEALIRLGPAQRRIQITLARRPDMLFRLILGRQALAGAFLVDVSRTYVQRRR
jgi:hypothetical protein